MTDSRPADEPEYLRLNRANWDDRAPVHATSPDYERQSFIDDPTFLSGVVRFDLPRLGDVSGLEVVHLQCHIGTDTISLARLGARVTGLDLSPASVAEARRLAGDARVDAEWVVSDVYDAPAALGGRRFDLVYVSLGALCWLPSVDRWAAVVAALLRPGGRLFVRDSHPALDTLDHDPVTGLLTPTRPYFERDEPDVWDDPGTYAATADGDATPITHTTTHSWNHGLGETLTALVRHGLRIELVVEHVSVPFRPFPDLMVRTEPVELGEWQLAEHPERMPLSFTVVATATAAGDPARRRG